MALLGEPFSEVGLLYFLEGAGLIADVKNQRCHFTLGVFDE